MSTKKSTEEKILKFKGIPLARCRNMIYYGDKKDRFIVELTVKSSHELQDLKIAEKVSVKLLDTDPSVSANKKIIKISEKNSLYNALDIGATWLDRASEFNNQ